MASLQDVPPGYDSVTDVAKPKTKSAKRNERKKEKRLQVFFFYSSNSFFFFYSFNSFFFLLFGAVD